MSDNQACCAHCKVSSKHIDNPNGTRSEYWECDYGCGTRFAPTTLIDRERSTIKELLRKMDDDCADMLNRQDAEIKQLEVELAELQKDKERLDWTEDNKNYAKLIFVYELMGKPSNMKTLRQALDAAISRKDEDEKESLS